MQGRCHLRTMVVHNSIPMHLDRSGQFPKRFQSLTHRPSTPTPEIRFRQILLNRVEYARVKNQPICPYNSVVCVQRCCELSILRLDQLVRMCQEQISSTLNTIRSIFFASQCVKRFIGHLHDTEPIEGDRHLGKVLGSRFNEGMGHFHADIANGIGIAVVVMK